MINETTITKIVSTSSISFATIFAITHEMQQALTILTILIGIDFVTGVIKSWINKETSSEGMSRGLIRKMILVLVPLTIALAGNGLNYNLSSFATWVISALIMSEVYSVIANVYTIQTGNKAKEYDVMTIIIQKFGKIIDIFLTDKK